MNFALVMSSLLSELDWSLEDLARELNYKYSFAYLQKVRDGRPFVEAEEEIMDTLMSGIAKKIEEEIDLAQYPRGAGASAGKAFNTICKRFGIRAEDLSKLAEKFRVEFVYPSDKRSGLLIYPEIDWEMELARIALDLTQGNLFSSEDTSDSHESESEPTIINHDVAPTGAFPAYYRTATPVCLNTHLLSEKELARGECDICSARPDDYH